MCVGAVVGGRGCWCRKVWIGDVLGAVLASVWVVCFVFGMVVDVCLVCSLEEGWSVFSGFVGL